MEELITYIKTEQEKDGKESDAFMLEIVPEEEQSEILQRFC